MSALWFKHWPPKAATIKFINPQSPAQMSVTPSQVNVDQQKDALKRQRENQKRQKGAEHSQVNLDKILDQRNGVVCPK